MSKADRIRALYAEGKSTTEIAAIVGCRQEYVRVCARQRRDGAESHADRDYRRRMQDLGQRRGDRAAARAAYKSARIEADEAGLSKATAQHRAIYAYRKTLVKTAKQSIGIP